MLTSSLHSAHGMFVVLAIVIVGSLILSVLLQSEQSEVVVHVVSYYNEL